MSKLKYYTGVGSRDVTPEIKALQISIGERMASLGYILLSGGAEGSDINFQEGACRVDSSLCVIYLPWSAFNKEHRLESFKGSTYIIPDEDDSKFAKEYLLDGIIPWYDNMKQGAQKLHNRNVFQCFHHGDTSPWSSVVIYSAPENSKGVVKGGTASCVKIGRKEGLPTFNLSIPEQCDKLLEYLDRKEGLQTLQSL